VNKRKKKETKQTNKLPITGKKERKTNKKTKHVFETE
jgi:hypothetical protein